MLPRTKTSPRRTALRLLDAYLVTGVVALLGAAVLQLPFERWLAGGTHWGYCPGWQREIAFWNLALLAIVVQALAWGDTRTKLIVVRGGMVLSLLTGGNHLFEALGGGEVYTHVWGVANFAYVMLGAAVLWMCRASPPPPPPT
jgi:KinB signaling pathway activation protein